MLWLLSGSSTIEPTASVGCPSVRAVQLAPPSVVFHTPPMAPPTYMVVGVFGSTTIADSRPETGESSNTFCVGCGPIGDQTVPEAGGAAPSAGIDRPRTLEGVTFPRASLAIISLSCRNASSRTPPGIYPCG